VHDVAEKERRGYTDPRSRVYFDGRERLHGKDWAKRKQEVWERGSGRCENGEPWKVWPWGGPVLNRCTNEMHDPHHKITRGKQRDDRMENLIGLCRMHHDMAHEKRNPHWGDRHDKRQSTSA
jgi:hypothetical protein